MLYATITIDLPSEELLRRKTAREWLAGLIGREPELGTGEGLSTVTGLIAFERIVAALREVEIRDVLSATVDGKVAYVDTDQNSGDLETAVAELDARGVLELPFEAMQLVLSERAEGLHTLVEVRLRRRVPTTVAELVLAFAGRVEAMQIQRGESPEEFAARLRALAESGEAVARARERFAAKLDAASRALARSLGELALETKVSPVALRLIRPGPRALDHLRRLPWGAAVRMPSYRPVPVRQRSGAYDEPFYHHYFDPYFDFVAWVTLTELVAGRGWPGLDYEVVDADGERAFTAADAHGQAATAGEFGPGVTPVRIARGQLIVDPAVPVVAGPDPGEITDPRMRPGFGGDGRVDEGAVGADWGEVEGGVEGGDLGGSCGASCGGCGA